MVHLRLHSHRGLEARHGRRRGPRPQALDPLADRRVSARETAGLEFLQGAFDGQVRVAFEQFLQDRLILVEDAAAPLLRWESRRGRTLTLRFDPGQDAIDGATRNPQLRRDRPDRRALLTPLHDLQPRGFVHDRASRNATGPSACSATRSAWSPSSRSIGSSNCRSRSVSSRSPGERSHCSRRVSTSAA